MKKTLALVLVVLLVLSIGLTACKQAETPATPDATPTPEVKAEPKVLRVGADEPPALDPQIGTDQVSIGLNNLLLEGLVRIHDGKVQPGMAEKWEISADGLTYTFHLRDAKWNDGKSVTAQDFEYSWRRLVDPKTASEYAFQGYYIVNGEEINTGKITDLTQLGVKAVDEKTLVVTLKAPCTYFLSLAGFLSFMPSREDKVTEFGEAYGTEVDKFVTNGPFLFKEWTHEANYAVEKNPNYWNAAAIKLDRIEYTVVVDAATAINMYEAGDIDMVGLTGNDIQRFKDAGKPVYDYMDGALFYLQVNLKGKSPATGKFLANQNFRLALGYALDRQAIIDAIMKNKSLPGSRLVPDNLMGVKDRYTKENPWSFWPANADSAKAKSHLELALKELNTTVDKLPTFELLNYEGDRSRQFGEAMQDMWLKNLGVKFEMKQIVFKEKLQLATNQQYDVDFAGWGPDYDDAMTFMDLFVKDGGHNNTGWGDARHDELINGAKVEADPVKRSKMMFEAEQIVVSSAPVIPIYARARNYTMQDYVKNVVRSAMGADPDFVYTDIVK